MAALVSAAVLLAGCGSGGSDGEPRTADGLTVLKLGVSSIGDLAPLYLGQKKGFFRDERLRLELQPQQGGAVTITGVASGDFQAGYANTTSLLVANTKGLPLRAIAPAAQVGTNPRRDDYTAIMVRRDSAIRSPADLAGKTLAANTLESQTDSTVKAALKEKGVDPASVKFLEIPFPDQIAALESGRVDAITPIEPFVTLAEDAGLRTVLDGYFSTGIPNYTTGVYFTSERYEQENPDVVARLRRGIERSLAYARAHDDEVRATIPDFTSIKPALARRVALPIFAGEFDQASLRRLSDVIVEYRLAEKRPDLEAVIGSGG